VKKRLAIAFGVLLAAAPLAMAGGAGGIGFAMQAARLGLSNADPGMSSIMGYGYGVMGDGERIGGFGSALLSLNSGSAGGVGGMMIGQELRAGPFVVAVTLWGGVGGAAWNDEGYMLAFGEADAEIGLRLLPWAQITFYAGYQVWGNVVPGVPMSSVYIYSPVMGIRLGWGSFR
jgi:hypothetical protein